MKKLMAILISLTMLCCAALPALAEAQTGARAVKDETVYILSAADGSTRKIIVSDYLSNPDGAAELADVSALADIVNVKGEQTFENGVWQADGADIYYQGAGETPLPVEMNISYRLDGEEIAPEELAGKDGHVAIRFDFSVEQTAAVELEGGVENVRVPYVVITGALLENDVFKNVEVVNGRAINDGDHTFVLGLALPDLLDSLALGDELAKDVELTEYVEIEADVEGFALPVTLSLATSEVFAKLDADKMDDASELKAAMNELTDGVNRLLDGSGQLVDGLTALDTGVAQLADGVEALSEGLDALVSNNDQLVSASTQVFETLLATANEQLAAAGAEVPKLTIENYDASLAALIDAMSEDGITRQAQLEEAVLAQREQLGAYNAFHSGLIAYTQGVFSAADGASQLKDGVPTLKDGVAQLLDGAQDMRDGLASFSSEGVERLDKLVNEDLEALLERVRGLIYAAQNSQNYSGIAEGTDGAARFIWRTDAIGD